MPTRDDLDVAIFDTACALAALERATQNEAPIVRHTVNLLCSNLKLLEQVISFDLSGAELEATLTRRGDASGT